MNNDAKNTLGDRLVQVRKILGLKQIELAKQVEMSQSALSDIERNVNGLSFDLLSIYVNKFAVNPYYLINGTLPVFNATLGDSTDSELAIKEPETDEAKSSMLLIADMLQRLSRVEYWQAKHGPIGTKKHKKNRR